MEKSVSAVDKTISERASHVNTQLMDLTGELQHYETVSKMRLNAPKSCENPVILQSCGVVHIGPKINFLTEQEAKNSFSKIKNEKFVEFRERLKNYYKRKNAYMRSLLSDGKRSDLPIKKYFVDVKLRKTDLLGEEMGENIHFEKIFSKEYRNKAILLTGDPGYGKTTLCNKVAYDWSIDEKSGYLRHFDFVIVIALRELQQNSVYDAVIKKLCGDSKELKTELRKANQKFLIILDGLDEIRDKSSILKFMREESVSLSAKMMILITCRPHVSEYVREDMDMRFALDGFLSEQQLIYIKLMFNSDNSKIDILVQKLKDEKFYSGLAICPLMLHLLCYVHKNESLHSIGKRTDLYVQIFSLIIKRYTRKFNDKHSLKKGIYFLGEDLLVKLGYLAMHPDGNILQISSKMLKNYFPVEEEYDFILGLDILRQYSVCEEDDIIYFDFVHNTFQDFLVALFMYHFLKHGKFSDPCTNNTLLFCLGLSGYEPLSDYMLQYLNMKMFDSELMIQADVEVKSDDTWKTFCSSIKLLFCPGEIHYHTKLFTRFQFKRIYLCLPGEEDEFEKVKEEIIAFHEDYSFADSLEIYLFLNRKSTFVDEYYDIRQPAARIIDLLWNTKLNKFKFSLCGVTDYGQNFAITSEGSNFEYFRSIENPISLTDEIKRDLDINKDDKFVALKVMDMKKSEIFSNIEKFIVISRPIFIKYFISVEQYEVLRDHIIMFPAEDFSAFDYDTIDLFCHV